MDSRDCPTWLCSAGAAVIRFLLQHCMTSHYPPSSLNSVVLSLTKLAQQPNKNKQWPLMMENTLAALESIVARAATLFRLGFIIYRDSSAKYCIRFLRDGRHIKDFF